MPAYSFRCPKCNATLRRILPKFEKIKCACGTDFELDSKNNQSMMIKEVLDNGAMTRSVERLADIKELVKERSKEPEKEDLI